MHNHHHGPCGCRPPQHPLHVGELKYSADQINELLDQIPKKADRSELHGLKGGFQADEEDLTIVVTEKSGKIKFKDRDTTKGKGYIILRTGKPLSEQMVQENTIYEVRYNFDLNGETLEIPSNCVLDFKGGSFSNGTLQGNETFISADICKIFNTDIIINGTWNVEESFPEWFGAKGDGANDDTLAIQCSLDYFVTTKLLDKTYLLKTITDESNQSCLTLAVGKNVIGCCSKSALTDENGTLKVDDSISPKIILYIDGKNKISSINIRGNDFKDSTLLQTGIKTKSNAYVTIENVGVSNAYYGFNMCVFMSTMKKCISAYNYIGFYIRGLISNDVLQAENTSIFMENCYAVDSYMQGFYLRGLIYSTLISCGADGCGWQGCETPITTSRRVESYWIKECKGLSLIGCGMEQATKAVKWSSCLNCSWRDSVFILKNNDLAEDYSFDKTFMFGYCQNIIFENIRVKHDGIPFNSSNKLFYFESSSIGLQYAKIINLQNLYDGNLYDLISIAGMTTPKYDCVDITEANFRRKIGTTAQRPNVGTYDKNQRYWDETIASPLLWDGSAWRNDDGTLETKVKFI